MSINHSMRPVLALLTGLLLVGIVAIMLRTFNLLPNLTGAGRTSTPRTVASQNPEFTPEIPITSPSRTLSVTSTPLVTSSDDVSKVVLTTRAVHVALRAGPHINHPGASKNYDKGTPMEVLGTRDSWYFVIAPDGTKGWLYEEWLNIVSADLTNIPRIMIVPTAPLSTRVPPEPEREQEREPQAPPNQYP
jgi:hypothetical protein